MFGDLRRHISAFYFRSETLGGLLQNEKKDEIFVTSTIIPSFITTLKSTTSFTSWSFDGILVVKIINVAQMPNFNHIF